MKEILIDGVERPTVRRKNNKTQKKEYSGKKKRHSRQNIVATDNQKRIIYLSPTKHGSIHDKRLLDKTGLLSHIPDDVSVLVDTGFQGIQKQHSNVLIPTKRSKYHPLTEEQKQENHLISSVRIVVEHAIGGMKRFSACRDIFRGRKKQDDSYMSVGAGLYNLGLT